MFNSRLLAISCVKHLNRFVANDINAKNLRHLPKLCLNYSTVSPPESSTMSTESVDTGRESLPLIINRQLQDMDNLNPKVTPIREVWLENMSSIESLKLSIVSLHPYIWGAFPRVDLIQECHKWQTLYKHIDWRWMPVRAELSNNNKKPWPQKGTGRARAKGVRAPQWKNGGWCHGPRGPKTYFYILPFPKRVKGLISMLSAKLAQNDLKVVDSFDIPSDKSSYIEDLCQARGWGPSVLFVDTSDIFSRNIAIATNDIKHINLMPVYGLNVFSMLKHETLVLTLDAVEDIENKLLFQLRRTDLRDVMKSVRSSKGYIGR